MRVPLILLICALLLSAAADQPQADLTGFDSKLLGVRAENIDDNIAVRTITYKRDFPCVGVYGNREFKLEIVDVHVDEPVRMLLALSDGTLHELDLADASVQMICPYLQSTYGLALAWFPDGSREMMTLSVSPAWKPADADSIHWPAPPRVKPESSEEPVQAAIDDWWERVVTPLAAQQD